MRIEQNLHGYVDGHRLLAGSIDFPRQVKYMMLGLSDMSGRSMVPGFEEYLTGYPLPDAGFYAFARTWYAPEVDRPGCVWTHTLLIREKDIGAVRNFGTLRRLFRRPTKGDRGDWEAYCIALEHAERDHEAHVAGWMEQNLAFALWGLYGADLPLFHPAEDARQLEDMLLALWSQQWPSLRFTFRFCSGAIGVRLSEGSAFDYQVIPPTSMRDVRREVVASNMVASGGWTNPPKSAHWLSIASEDVRRGGTSFRSFLRDHTDDEFDGRKAFAPLGDLFAIWQDVSGRTTFPCLVAALGKHYPTASEADGLKQSVVGPSFPLAISLLPGTSECEVLKTIATTTVWSAFDPEKLKVYDRARALWENERKSAEALIASLIGAELNPVGEHVLRYLIADMSVEDAIRNEDTIPGLLAAAVRLNPGHAKSPSVWKGPPDHQRSLFDAATETGDIPTELQRSIVLAMLQAGSDAVAEHATLMFGAVAVDTLMNWFDKSGVSSPWDIAEGWRRALSRQTSALLDWLAGTHEVREASGALIADLSNPHSTEVHSRGADIWLKVLTNPGAALHASVKNRLYAFLLALGFDAPAGRPEELVARTFDTVHGALATHLLDDDSWGWLQDQLPTLSMWRHWDRCERLRRGLAVIFVRHQWPVAKFLRCAPNRDILKDLLKACNKIEGGDRLLERIRNALTNGELLLDQETRDVVEWYS